MSTWLITLIVVVVVAAVLVAVVSAGRNRRRRSATGAIGLPPIGALSGDEPAVVEPEARDAVEDEACSPRRSSGDRPVG